MEKQQEVVAQIKKVLHGIQPQPIPVKIYQSESEGILRGAVLAAKSTLVSEHSRKYHSLQEPKLYSSNKTAKFYSASENKERAMHHNSRVGIKPDQMLFEFQID